MLSIIDKMQSQNVIHNDIRFDNIMMRGNRPFVIDFGISFTYDDMMKAAGAAAEASGAAAGAAGAAGAALEDIFFVFAPQHYILAPEIHYISFLLHKRPLLKRNNWKEVKDSIQNNQSIIRLLYPVQNERNDYYQNMEESFRHMENQSLKTIVQEFTWKTFDTYMLCMILIDFLIEIKENISGLNHFNTFFALLKTGIHPNPQRRNTLSKLQEGVKPLLKQIHKYKGMKRNGKQLTNIQKNEIEKRSSFLSQYKTLKKPL